MPIMDFFFDVWFFFLLLNFDFFFLNLKKNLFKIEKKKLNFNMRCANCSQGIAENFSLKPDKKCVVCNLQINQCPCCKSIETKTCVTHTKRQHICISKCLKQCILIPVPIIPNKKKRHAKPFL